MGTLSPGVRNGVTRRVVMDLYHSVATFILFLGVAWVRCQQLCDQCDCSLSEDTEDARGITNIKPVCSEGKIRWSRPYGALRLELHPVYTSDFRACFIVISEDTMTQVYQEVTKMHISNYRLKIHGDLELTLQPLLTVTGKSREFCVDSTGEPVRLYLETERTLKNSGFPRITILYDVERKHNKFFFNPMDECRPCDERELLRAYCSSDFVLKGSMADVFHNKDTGKTEIKVEVSQVIQQRGEHFKRTQRGSGGLQGVIHAPLKCGIRHGEGQFLFTGRLRLGEPILHCAPFIEQWKDIMGDAIRDGRMECTRN